MEASIVANDEPRFKHHAKNAEGINISLLSLEQMKEKSQNALINQEIDKMIVRYILS